MPRHIVKHRIPVPQVQLSVIFSLNWHKLGISGESVPHGEPKLTAEATTDSAAPGKVTKEGFALAEPSVSPCPSTLILVMPRRTELRSPGHPDFLLPTLQFC